MSKKNSENIWIKTLSIIVAISIGLNVILILKRTEVFPSKKKLIIEKTQLNKKLSQHRNELNKLKGISLRIDKVIHDANAKLEAKEKLISNLKDLKEKERKKFIYQVDSLKEKYLTVIDSLLVEREEKRVINNKIEYLEETITELNKKLGYAGWLVADNFKVTPLKKSNSDKKNQTVFARRVDKLDVCFDVLENRIAKVGTKNIYVIITTPDAKVIFDAVGGERKFNHPEYKKLADCSLIDQFEYEKQKINFCTQIIPNMELIPGLYVAEIYTDGYKLAMTTFSLR